MKYFTVQPFNQRIYVTTDPERFRKRYNLYATGPAQMEATDLAGCEGMAVFTVRENRAPYALFMMYLSKDAQISTIFHEALHMTHFLMEYTVMPIDLGSTELQAYTMEHIAAAVLKKLSKGETHGRC